MRSRCTGDWRFGATRAATLAATLALLVTASLAATAPSASALVVRLPNGHRVSMQPLRGAGALTSSPAARTFSGATGFAGSGNLQYHGGPVMPSNTNYTLYWRPSGAPGYPPEYQSGVNAYLEDLAHDSGGAQNVDSVATQYGDKEGHAANYSSHFGGALIDTDPYPINGCTAAAICLTDAQIQSEIKSYVKAHGLPEDLAHEYFLLTPPEVEDCFDATGTECSAGATNGVYCAYHGSFSDGGSTIVYSNDPYVTGNFGCDDGEHPNNKPSDGVLEGGLSHEHNESITDPELNAWYDASGFENGDKCRTFNATTEYGVPLGTASDGAHYNQIVNSDLYWYQQEWSNEGSHCLQRYAPAAPAITKLVPKTGPASGGTTVTISGTGLTGATAVKFGTVKASSFTVNSATSITAKAPASTPGTVDVTVTTPVGTSAITLKDHYKFTPTVTSVSPSSGPSAGGTTVAVKGSGFVQGATTIKFGTTASKSVICSSSTECTALSPKHEPALVDVVASVNNALSPKTSADKFTFS
jgi:hypothetical protein